MPLQADAKPTGAVNRLTLRPDRRSMFSLRLVFAIVTALAAVNPSISRAGPPDPNQLVQSSLLFDRAAIKPGEPFYAAVKLTIAHDWHIYWKYPGDAGVPTTVDWTPPPGYRAEPIAYPLPRRIDAPGDITMFGYDDEVWLISRFVPLAATDPATDPPADATAPPAAPAGPPARLTARVQFLVCKEECIPGQAKLSLSVPSVGGGQLPSTNVDPMSIERWLAKVPQTSDPKHISSIEQKVQPEVTNLEAFKSANVVLLVNWIVPQPDERPMQVDFYPVPGDSLSISKIRIIDYGPQTRIMFRVEAMAGAHLNSPTFEGVVAYTTRTSPRVAVSVPIKLVSVSD